MVEKVSVARGKGSRLGLGKAGVPRTRTRKNWPLASRRASLTRSRWIRSRPSRTLSRRSRSPWTSRVPRPCEADRVAGEPDRVEQGLAVLDPEGDVGRVERGLGGRREAEELEQGEEAGELAEVALGDVRLALALEGPQVVAQTVEVELAGDLAAEPLAAGERPGIALKVGAMQLERGVVAGRAVEADLETADDLAAEQAAADVAQRGEALLDVQGRFQLRDLLAVQADAAQIQGAMDFQVAAVGFTPDVGKLPLHVLQRQAGLDACCR